MNVKVKVNFDEVLDEFVSIDVDVLMEQIILKSWFYYVNKTNKYNYQAVTH